MRLFLALAFVASYVVIHAQAPADNPSFEVASVKPNTSGAVTGKSPSPEGDRVTAYNTRLLLFVQVAYNIGADRIVGAPDWTIAEKYDVVAKAGQPLTGNTWQLMLRSLLAERFKLVVHTETREAPVFALVKSRRDGSLGPNLRSAQQDCAVMRAATSQTPDADPCGMRSLGTALVRGTMSLRGVPITMLLGAIARDLRRDVVDRTGITGLFDIDLTWTPQTFVGRPADGRFPSIDRDGPEIFTALQEQLGLKVEQETGQTNVLVIDHVERPTPD